MQWVASEIIFFNYRSSLTLRSFRPNSCLDEIRQGEITHNFWLQFLRDQMSMFHEAAEAFRYGCWFALPTIKGFVL